MTNVFNNMENVVVPDTDATVRTNVTEAMPIICLDDKPDTDGTPGYHLLENNRKTFYKADYLKTLISTGKMIVANLLYNIKTRQLEFYVK